MQNDIIALNSFEVNFSGKIAVGTTNNGILKIFKLEKENIDLLTSLEGHTAPVVNAKFMNNNYIVSIDFTGGLIIWDKENNMYCKKIVKQIIDGSIYDMSILEQISGNYLVFCASNCGKIIITEFFEINEINSCTIQVHENDIISLDNNTEFLVSVDLDGIVKCTSILGSKLQDSITIYKVNNEPTVIKITRKNCFDKTFIAIGTGDGVVTILERDIDTAEFKVNKVIQLEGPIYSLVWSKGGFSLSVLFSKNECIKVFEITEEGSFEEVEVEDY